MQSDIPFSHTVHGITHPTSVLIPEKFNFFGDCVSLLTRKSGEHVHFETETHLSLIHTLQYFVDSELRNKSLKFALLTRDHVKYILRTHPLLDPKDRMVKSFYEDFLPLKAKILQNSIDPIKNSLTEIKKDLAGIAAVFEKNYIENIVRKISRYINCNDELIVHQKDFDYYARIFVSYYYLNEFSRVEISDLIKQVLKGKVIRDGDKIYQEGPLPPDLLKKLLAHNKSGKPFDKALFDEFQSYFVNRNMEDQIKGFLSYAQYGKSTFSFLFKVNGILLYDDELEIDGLRLINTQTFVEKNETRVAYDDVKFFLQKNSALIMHEVNAHSQDEAVKKSISDLKRKLSRIGFFVNKQLQLDTSGYLVWFENDGVLMLNDLYENNIFANWDSDILIARNGVIKKEEHNLFLLNIEKILAEAHSEIDNHKSLHTYYRFIEQITKDCIEGIPLRQNLLPLQGLPPEIISIALLFLLDEKQNYKHLIQTWSYTVLINSYQNRPGSMGISDKDFAEIRKRRRVVSYNKLLKKVKHNHTLYRIKTATGYYRSADIRAFHYYLRFLLMLKKHRNIGEHLNDNDELIMRKLKLPINTLLKRILILITTAMSKSENNNKTPQEVINNLIREGRQKAVQLGQMT